MTDEELMHYGVKGMRWGHRKAELSDSQRQERRAKIKKAAIIVGSAAAIAAVAAGAYYVSKNSNVKVSDLKPQTKEVGDKFAKAFAKEPVGIIHASRGRSRGFTFPQHGGLDDPLLEYTRSPIGNGEAPPGFFARYGDRMEKVATTFLDPLGRKDQAGRIIPHEVILPESLAKGVNSSSDAEKVAWPLIKDVYAAFYDSKAIRFEDDPID